MNEAAAIAFSLSKTWSYRTKKEAIDAAGSFEKLISESEQKIKSLDLDVGEKQIKKLRKQNGWLWIYGTSQYPAILAKIPDPPLVVYGIGASRLDEENTLAFIGTRNPTPYGRRIALWLGRDLVSEGCTIVSGLARGIDSIGHTVSVDTHAPTIAVLAHGLDTVYPPENKKLAQQIIECGGTLVSEFPFGIKPQKGYFSMRNRIISGLSKSTLVIEAGEKSGTKLTVTHALEQSREVMAVPGPIDSEYSAYTNELIFSGALMVRTSADVLEFYPNRKKREVQVKADSFKLNPLQTKILNFLNRDSPRSIEEFISKTQIDSKQVLQNLTELELHGKIQKQPNSMYILLGQ